VSYVNTASYAKTLTIPISLPQTELKRGRSVRVASWNLKLGERLELRSLTLHVLRILTPGPQPIYTNTALGAASAGIYLGETVTSPIAWTFVGSVGAASTNPFHVRRMITPGTYTVIVSNNTANLDLAVCATGCVRLLSL
jgi:hypothetical protein